MSVEENIDIPTPVTVRSGLITTESTSGMGVILPATQVVKVSGETVVVASGPYIQLSGQGVQISGQGVILPATQVVKVSGEFVEIVSGQTVQLPSTQVVNISGQAVILGEIDGDLLSVDSGSTSLISMATPHFKVHRGEAYSVSYYDADSDQVSCSIFTITFPISGAYHTNITATADGAGLIHLFEGHLGSGGTAAITEYNLNRAIGTSSLVLFASGGNFLSGQGTLIWQGLIGANNNKTKVGGDAKTGLEWVFSSGTYALFYYPAADSKQLVVRAEMYEVV